MQLSRLLLASLLALSCESAPLREAPPARLDVVLHGGRVMDPESGLDGIRNVGIRDGRIVAISTEPLDQRLGDGGTRIDASGLIVAPGFIDLHAHGMSDKAFQYRVMDGVTTALELEWGYPRIREWLESREGKARIHYGASVSHGFIRARFVPEVGERLRAAEGAVLRASRSAEPLVSLRAMLPDLRDANYLDVPESSTSELLDALLAGLREGGLGIGVAHQYYPGASRREIFRVFQFAGQHDVPIFTHVREMSIAAMQEVIANAAATRAPLHIVHVNSMSGDELPEILELIKGARTHGLDVTTESYPYTAGSSGIGSALFDDGWQERLGISYEDVQWQDTGERLTEATFARYREAGGTVIIHFMKEANVDLAIRQPWVIVAADAMPYAPGAHPRSAGAFARVLGRYVRERGQLDLMTALCKMSLLPARRLEDIAPAMRDKGRIRAGADADLVLFDPQEVIDTATFEDAMSFSKGFRHVLVGGIPVVRDGELVEDVFPGQPVVGRYLQPR